MRFDRFYANCPVCSPTRSSLMTGRYPDLAGVPGVIRTHQNNSWGYLNPDLPTLPDKLRKAGYHTAIVGKWHLGLESPNTPNERGFDHFHGFLGDMMDDYWHHRRHGNNYMRLNGETIDPEGHATDLFSRWASEYIEQRPKGEQPFFLYLALNAPHTPIHPPADWVTRVKQRESGIDPARAELVALIEHMDDGIGRVLQTLETSGHTENTLVIFSSDNGGQLNVGANNGGLHGGKQNMWEGGLRVPNCVVWPGHVEPGSRTGRVALTMDYYPTLCEVAGVPVEHTIDGLSLLPTLLGQAAPEFESRTVFWVRREGGREYGGRAYYAARRGDWKLLQNTPFEPLDLYNLGDDAGEERPLGDRHPEFANLFNALSDHVNRSGAVPWQPPHVAQ
jgi:arylsulfatase A-like enzyme